MTNQVLYIEASSQTFYRQKKILFKTYLQECTDKYNRKNITIEKEMYQD